MKLCRAVRHGSRSAETGVARRCRAADVAGVVVTTDTGTDQWLVVGGVSLDARAPPWRFHKVPSQP